MPKRFYKDRPSPLRRLLPFWVAIWMERTLFILVPLIALAVPIFAYLPELYDWRIRGRLDRWYAELTRIERGGGSSGDHTARLTRLEEIDAALNRLQVPRGYLDRLYTLRTHAAYVRGVLASRRSDVGAPAR